MGEVTATVTHRLAPTADSLSVSPVALIPIITCSDVIGQFPCNVFVYTCGYYSHFCNGCCLVIIHYHRTTVFCQ